MSIKYAKLFFEMGIKFERSVYEAKDPKTGKVRSKALSIPPEINSGEVHTGAADTLVLSDPTGRIPPEVLHQWLEENIEPLRFRWLEEQKGR